MAGSKAIRTQSDDDNKSQNDSEHEKGKNEYVMSPLNEHYNDFEEFTNNYKKKQQEILDEFSSINKNNFYLVNQLANNLNSEGEDGDEQNSQNSVRMSNKEIDFDSKVSIIHFYPFLGCAFAFRN